MLVEQLLRSRRAIRRRIAPPIQEIAAVAATSTQVAGRFLTGRAVIDHPNFTVTHRHDDLVKVCVVGALACVQSGSGLAA